MVFQMEGRRYIGVPTRDLPAGSLPSNVEVLRLIYSFGDMKTFRWSKAHCPRTPNIVGCSLPAGCLSAGGSLCLFRVLREKWNMFPAVKDFSVLKKLENLKNKYTKECKKRVDSDEYVQELEETFNLAAPDHAHTISSDISLSPAMRTELLSKLEDYIGRDATR